MTTTKSNIKKVECYGCDFGKHIPDSCPNWRKDKCHYRFLRRLFNKTDFNKGARPKKNGLLRCLFDKGDIKDEKYHIYKKVYFLRHLYSLHFSNVQLHDIVNHLYKHQRCISNKIECGNQNIVKKIAISTKDVNKGNKRQMCFATKFCFLHNETAYPICDSFAREALKHHKKKLGKTHPNYEKLNTLLGNARRKWHAPSEPLNYSSYKNVIDYFIEIYDLGDITYKELDWFLWVFGKISLGNPRAEILKKMALIPRTS